MSPRMDRARCSYSSLQGLLTRAWNLKDLKMLYRIHSLFYYTSPPKKVILNIPFLSSEDWKTADLSLSAILNLGSSGTT